MEINQNKEKNASTSVLIRWNLAQHFMHLEKFLPEIDRCCSWSLLITSRSIVMKPYLNFTFILEVQVSNDSKSDFYFWNVSLTTPDPIALELIY